MGGGDGLHVKKGDRRRHFRKTGKTKQKSPKKNSVPQLTGPPKLTGGNLAPIGTKRHRNSKLQPPKKNNTGRVSKKW